MQNNCGKKEWKLNAAKNCRWSEVEDKRTVPEYDIRLWDFKRNGRMGEKLREKWRQNKI